MITLTVKELKEQLENFDDDLEVIVESESEVGGYLREVNLGVIIEEDSDIHIFLPKRYVDEEDCDDKIGDCVILSDL